jgi:asparaginyl-tRNA synthetase (EC 6.1.1.22)
MLNDKFYKVSEVFNLEEGKAVKLRGWINNIRVQGGLTFIDLRDSTGIIQVTLKKSNLNEKLYEEITNKARRESSLIIEGTVKNDPRAPGGKEILCNKVEIISYSEVYPIRKGLSISKLLDLRHLYFRRPRFQAILKIRNTVIDAAREWFKQNGFFEIHCPTFITAAVEGGATLFEVDYFGKKAYLTQSSQFYLEAAIFGFEKVFTIQPSFRAEKSRTRKHLTEFWHIEAEMAFASHEDIINVEEELVYYIVSKVIDERKRELEILNRSIDKPKRPFLRISYLDAIKLLNEKGIPITFGEDITTEAEKTLAKIIDRPAFIMYFPKTTRAFYHMPHPEDNRLTLSSDLYVPNEGEITTGGQRIHDLNLLIERIKENNLNPSDYEWYLDLRRYGSVPHAGFGLGVERLVKWITGVSHIRETIPFPRTPVRVYP